MPAEDKLGVESPSVGGGGIRRSAPHSGDSGVFTQDGGHTDLKGSTVRGGAVTIVAQALKFLLSMGSTVVLARLLTPSDYGLVAMVTGVTGFVEVFKDAGLSMATVQRVQITEGQISTLFWLNAALSALLMLAVVALAPVLSLFYGDPRLVWVTIGLSTTFLLGGLGVQHQALLRRNMRFKELATIEIVTLGAASGTGISLALLGFGYWALVGMNVAAALVSLTAVWIAMPWWPGRLRRGSGVAPMLTFGGNVVGSRVLHALVSNLPGVFIGSVWGAGPVGLYQKANALLMTAIDQVYGPVQAVATPSLSRVQTDPARLRRYFLAGYSAVVSVALPIVTITVVFAPEIIAVLLGRQWSAASTILRWLGLAGVFAVLIYPQGTLLLATGRTSRYLRLGFWDSVSVIAGYLGGLPYGTVGVAVGYFLARAITALPIMYATFKGTEVKLRDIVRTIKPPLVACLGAALTGEAARSLLEGKVNAWWMASIGCSVALGVYALILLVFFGKWDFYRRLFTDLFPNRMLGASGVVVEPGDLT